jgi:hypothetical protein
MKRIIITLLSCLSLSKIQSNQAFANLSYPVTNADSHPVMNLNSQSSFTRLSNCVVAGANALFTKIPQAISYYPLTAVGLTSVASFALGHSHIVPTLSNFLYNHPRSAVVGGMLGIAGMSSMIKKSNCNRETFKTKERLATIGLAAFTTALAVAGITYASSTLANRAYNYFDSTSFGRRTYIYCSPFVPGQSTVGFNRSTTRFGFFNK